MPTGSSRARERAALAWAGGGAAAIALTATLGSIGGPQGPVGALVAVLASAVFEGSWALAYLLSALGLGDAALRLVERLGGGRARERAAIAGALGFGLLLTLSHALGWAGAFGGGAGRATAVLTLAPGWAWGAWRLWAWWVAARARGGGALIRTPSAWWLAGVPAAVVLAVASCNPPGWLWSSEFGGYDALSYHLRLPQEWIALGALRPLEHCVYSYLPGYMEAAFYHLGVAMGAAPPSGSEPLWGLLSDGGRRLLATQWLHAGAALLAAWVIARMSARALAHCGLRGAGARTTAALAGVATLATPWSVVTGSLAYNEMAMVALGAAGMLAAMEQGLRPWARGALVGGLVGLACGAKPTAILFFTPVAGLLLIDGVRRAGGRAMATALATGALAGLLTLAPWMARNAASGGNPVFPAATGIFGSAHWDEGQVERWRSGHAFEGDVVDRLALISAADARDPAGARHRGMAHPQWGALWAAGLLGGALAIARPPTRRLALVLSAGLAAQVLAWLALTHIQSRFLMPCLPTLAALIALGAGGARTGSTLRTQWLPLGCALVQTLFLVVIFAGEGAGRGGANRWLALGPGVYTGEAVRPEDRWQIPAAWLNFGEGTRRGAGERTLVVGEAAVLYFAAPIDWTTTWDRSRLGALARSFPVSDTGASAFDAWRAALRAEGIGTVLVNWSELERLSSTGWHDPLITPEVVAAFLAQEARALPVPVDPAAGRPPWALYRLRSTP